MTRHIRVRTYILDSLKNGEKSTDQLFNGLKEKYPRHVLSRRSLANLIQTLPGVRHPDLDSTNIWILGDN